MENSSPGYFPMLLIKNISYFLENEYNFLISPHCHPITSLIIQKWLVELVCVCKDVPRLTCCPCYVCFNLGRTPPNNPLVPLHITACWKERESCLLQCATSSLLGWSPSGTHELDPLSHVSYQLKAGPKSWIRFRLNASACLHR